MPNRTLSPPDAPQCGPTGHTRTRCTESHSSKCRPRGNDDPHRDRLQPREPDHASPDRIPAPRLTHTTDPCHDERRYGDDQAHGVRLLVRLVRRHRDRHRKDDHRDRKEKNKRTLHSLGNGKPGCVCLPALGAHHPPPISWSVSREVIPARNAPDLRHIEPYGPGSDRIRYPAGAPQECRLREGTA